MADCPDFSLVGGACIPYPRPLPPCPHSGVTLRPSRVVGTKKGGKEVSERLTEVWDRGQVPSPPQEMGGRLEDRLVAQMPPFFAQPVPSDRLSG